KEHNGNICQGRGRLRASWGARTRTIAGASREEESYGRGRGERRAQGREQIAEPGRGGRRRGSCRKIEFVDLVGVDHFHRIRRDGRRDVIRRTLFTRCALRASAGGIGKNEPSGARSGV